HSLHADSVDQDGTQSFVTVRFGRVVFGDETADHDAREAIHHRQQRIEQRAADVLEVHVDATRARSAQSAGQVIRPVIDAIIEAKLADDVVALGLAAGDADDAATRDLPELSNDAADRTGGG